MEAASVERVISILLKMLNGDSLHRALLSAFPVVVIYKALFPEDYRLFLEQIGLAIKDLGFHKVSFLYPIVIKALMLLPLIYLFLGLFFSLLNNLVWRHQMASLDLSVFRLTVLQQMFSYNLQFSNWYWMLTAYGYVLQLPVFLPLYGSVIKSSLLEFLVFISLIFGPMVLLMRFMGFLFFEHVYRNS